MWLMALTMASALLASDAAQDRQVSTDLISEINAIRTDPAGYAKILEAYKSDYAGMEIRHPNQPIILTNEGVAAVDEAIAALQAQKPLAPLTADSRLDLMAQDHVTDQGPTGLIGHDSTDGSSFAVRAGRHGIVTGSGEDIAYGASDARSVAIELIIDDGVPSRGHRLNILNGAFKTIGTACGPHAKYGYMCVIDFGM